MKVDIPEPCHENWGEMSPTQRGAFCQSCAIDVIDFSEKNAEEVKETLRLNFGKKMCGRFKKSQLTDLSRSYQIWENQSAKTFQSKFLWACMIAFGLTLFNSCEDSNAQSQMIDTLNIEQTFTALEDSLKTEDSLSFVNGDVDVEDPNEVIMMLGEPMIEMPEIEDSDCTSIPEDMSKNETNSSQKNKEIVMGKIAPPPRFKDYLSDTVKVENLTAQIVSKTIEANAYPNPTSDFTTLKVQSTETARYVIGLYNLDGRFLRTIYTGIINQEVQNFEIDLSGYSTGTYLLKISNHKDAHALKINKVN